jgi:hypothetical protein
LSEGLCALELAQVSDELVARPAGRADGFDQRPVIVAFAPDAFAMTPQEHGRSVNPKAANRQRGLLHYMSIGRRDRSRNASEQGFTVVGVAKKTFQAWKLTNLG